MRVSMRDVVLLVLALVLVVPVWSSTTNHSLPHSLTPVLGSSECINKESREHFTLTASILQVGEEVGVPLSHCFTHQMTAHSAHFRAGDVWEICFDSFPSGPLTTATASLPLASSPPFSDIPIPITANTDHRESHKSLRVSEPKSSSSSVAAMVPLLHFPVVTVSSDIVFIIVDEDVSDTVYPNMSSCAPGTSSSGDGCNLRAAMLFCESFLSIPGRECIISLPPMGHLFLDPVRGEMRMDLARGVLRIEGNECQLSPLPSSTNTSRLFRVANSAEINDFMFSVSNMTIRGFGSDEWDGGAVYMESVSVTLDSVFFVNNAGLAGGAVCFHKCKGVRVLSSHFVNNTAASDGGGMYLSVDNVGFNITSCEFVGNSVIRTAVSTIGTGRFIGGGFTANEANEDLDFVDCFFHRNLANGGGGASFEMRNSNIRFVNSIFDSNDATNTVGGLDFTFSNSAIYVMECKFFNNYGATNTGGLRVYDGNVNIEIIDCVFRENESLYEGGALFVTSGNYYITISGTLFENNECITGYGGGLIVAYQNGYLDISNCTFRNNSVVSGFGGGMVIFYRNIGVEISNSIFEGNVVWTTGNGGALYVDNENDISLKDSLFSRNTAMLGGGGGIFFSTGNDDTLIENSLFAENTAGNGGGALTFVTDNRDTTILNCSFLNNRADGSGGAVYSALANSNMIVSKSIFSHNVARVYGGALYIGEQHARTTSILNSVLEFNSAYRAGGMFVFWYNDHILVDGCTIRFNRADRAAAAIRSMAWEVTIINSTISGNVAVHDYGGIYLDFALKVDIKNAEMSNNTAHGNYDTIYSDVDSVGCGSLGLYNCERVNVENCTFDSNAAYRYGGAVYIVLSNDVTIRNTIMRDNTALLGGAVSVYRSYNVVLDYLSIEGNVAEGDGGGISVFSATEVLVMNSSFLRNSVTSGSGSACYIFESSVHFENNAFDENEALESAGTVFWNYKANDGVEPSGLRNANNSFSRSNTAAYGDNWATDAVKVVALSASANSSSGVIDIIDYDSHVPTVIIILQDYYGQAVVTESEGFAQLSVLASSPRQYCGENFLGNIGGSIVEKFVSGEAIFAEVDAFCEPDGVMVLEASSLLVLENTEIDLRFRPCEVGEFFTDRICSPCPDGTYSFTDPAGVESLSTDLNSAVCKRCPTGADHCFRDQIVLKEGHWRINERAETILECPWGSDSCLGGSRSGEESCGLLYSGQLCAVCDPNHFHMASTNECVSCDDTSSWFDPFTVTAIIVLCLMLVMGGYYFNLMMREQELQSLTELFIYSVLKLKLVDIDVYVNAPLAVNENILILNRRLRALLKMYITFFQVVSSIPAVLHFHDFPDGFKVHMVQLSSVVNIDVSRAAMFNCLFGWRVDFVDHLLFITIYPALMLLLFIAVYHVHIYVKFRHRSASVPHPSPCHGEAGVVRAKYIEFFLFFTYLILPSLVVTIFETFRCQPVDPDDVNAGGDSYLRADYSISCHSSRYHFAVAWAVLMIFVYVLGVPAFYFYLLYSNRSAIMTRDLTAMLVDARGNSAELQQLSAIRILFDSYKPSFWYWELVETAFRLSLTGFLVLGVYAGDNAQMVLGFGLAVVFTKLYENFNPFLDEISQSSKVVTLWEISVIFFLFILVKTEFITDSAIVAVGLVLVVSVFVNIGVALLRILWQFYESTSPRNLEVLSQRDRSISGSMNFGLSEGGQNCEEGSKHRQTSVVFSPFDVEGKFTRKVIRI